jgi:hypothetical protein
MITTTIKYNTIFTRQYTGVTPNSYHTATESLALQLTGTLIG